MFLIIGTIAFTAGLRAFSRLRFRRNPSEFVWVAGEPGYRLSGGLFAGASVAVILLGMNAPRLGALVVIACIALISLPSLAAGIRSGAAAAVLVKQMVSIGLTLTAAAAVLHGDTGLWLALLAWMTVLIVAVETTVLTAGVLHRGAPIELTAHRARVALDRAA